jgi:hypothetical protein
MTDQGKQRSLPQILIELREDDIEFKRAITAHSFRASQTIAEPDVLNLNLFTLMKGRVQLIREGPNGPQAQALALRYPVLSWGLLQTIGQRLAQVENRMEEVAYKRLPERLAGLLLELANGGRAIRGTSHQSLADMLGTYRETISAILRGFKDDGLVELGYRKIELCDLPGLRMAAGALD